MSWRPPGGLRPRPSSTLAIGWSGQAALSARNRTQAANRCFGPNREYTQRTMIPSRTPGTVPIRSRPSGSRTLTSSDRASDPAPGSDPAAVDQTFDGRRHLAAARHRRGGRAEGCLSPARP